MSKFLNYAYFFFISMSFMKLLLWLFVGPIGVYLLDFFCSDIQFYLLLSRLSKQPDIEIDKLANIFMWWFEDHF